MKHGGVRPWNERRSVGERTLEVYSRHAQAADASGVPPEVTAAFSETIQALKHAAADRGREQHAQLVVRLFGMFASVIHRSHRRGP